MELINKKKLAKTALDEDFETFVMHIIALKALIVGITIHISQEPLIAVLRLDEAITEVLAKYSNFADMFLFKLAMELPENTGINKYAIKLEKSKQLSYGPI